jgi:ABC-type lipoprotein release transport system permease subunit
MSVCAAKSSGELIGVAILSTVKYAAKFAVYDEINIKVKNHQTAPTIRPDSERGEKSQVCCISEATENQNEFNKLNSLYDVVWWVVIVCVCIVKLLLGGA